MMVEMSPDSTKSVIVTDQWKEIYPDTLLKDLSSPNDRYLLFTRFTEPSAQQLEGIVDEPIIPSGRYIAITDATFERLKINARKVRSQGEAVESLRKVESYPTVVLTLAMPDSMFYMRAFYENSVERAFKGRSYDTFDFPWDHPLRLDISCIDSTAPGEVIQGIRRKNSRIELTPRTFGVYIWGIGAEPGRISATLANTFKMIKETKDIFDYTQLRLEDYRK